MRSSVAISLLLALPAWAQSPPKAPPKPPSRIDQPRIDRAIASGVAALRSAVLAGNLERGEGESERNLGPEELVLWTFVHAGVPETDPVFRKLFDGMMKAPLERTYRVSLQAMILEEVERVRYPWRIHQCAQFLVDNQNQGGRWHYGEPSPFADAITPSVDPKAAASAPRRGAQPPAAPARKVKPAVQRKIEVVQNRTANGGDNSNSQYAALGLRACHDAGIVFPKQVLERAERWWRECQKGGSGAGRGWCYGNHADHRPYGSMTAGGVGSLAIYDYIRDPNGSWKGDKDIQDGLAWLAGNFSVAWNPGPNEHDKGAPENSKGDYFYFLYGLERAGILCGVETIGAHPWYPEGAKVLLQTQRPSGEWGANAVEDTCFAILFLRRATRPLADVASVDRFAPKD